MALTRDFKQTVVKRVQRDPKFARALLDEAATLLFNGEPEVTRLVLRDLVNATIIRSTGSRMSLLFRYLAAVLLVSFSALANSQAEQGGVAIYSGFFTGDVYLTSPERFRRAYVVGVIDGLKMSPVLGANSEGVEWWKGCLKGKSGEQAIAIVDKFLKDNPARTQENMHALVYHAMAQGCPRP